MKRLFFTLLLLCAMCVAKGDEWTGTGFALKDGYIITNHHVVDGAHSLQVRGVKGDFTKLYNAVVVAKDESQDLAIIRIEDSKFTGFGEIPYAIKSGLSEVGEEIFVLGYPMGSKMDELTGVISSRLGFMGEISAYRVSTYNRVSTYISTSDGPMFDSNGDVVGIVNAKHRQAYNGYAIKNAVKSHYMRMFIKNSVSATIIPTNRRMVGWSLANKVEAIKPFVFVICASGEAHTAAPIQSIPSSPAPSIPQVRELSYGDTYKIGDIIRVNGAEGVVFEISDGGKHGKVVSVKESSELLKWSSNGSEHKRLIGANDETNGAYNMAVVKQITDWRNKYPAFRWCADLGEGWYLPAKGELLAIYKVKGVVNKSLESRGAERLRWYWSSTEFKYQYLSGEFCARIVIMINGYTILDLKDSSTYVRAVSAF